MPTRSDGLTGSLVAAAVARYVTTCTNADDAVQAGTFIIIKYALMPLTVTSNGYALS